MVAMVINIVANHHALELLPDSTFFANLQFSTGEEMELAALKIDKVLAFLIATAISASFTFLGQKYWLFKVRD
jgi:hypothetical protein